MSARSEHRYIANSLLKARRHNQLIADRESLRIDRRSSVQCDSRLPPPPSKAKVRQWMRANSCECETATELAEGAAAAFDFDGSDPLEDETHWIWDLAFNVFSA